MKLTFKFLILLPYQIFPAVFSHVHIRETGLSLVQSGETPSSSKSCILAEFLETNTSASLRIECGVQCSRTEQCVGMEIAGTKEKVCRIVKGFSALIPSQTSSGSISRYQKKGEKAIGKDYFCTIPLLNVQNVSTICHKGVYTWVLIQRRINGAVNFTRNWPEYESGFGSIDSEFWLGNAYIHQLTSEGYTYLRIEMMDHDCVWKYAEYATFKVEGSTAKYRLSVADYSGNAGDSLGYHDGIYFSTYDYDNDTWQNNCGKTRRGGWWYRACHKSNLNGEYNNTDYSDGINWFHWKGFYYSMKEVRMMLRKP
ncbi:ficolin-1-like [Saccostrea cucullata]|uniref:ficolin-1-like n=1 Tax=Saccostrea cuccullata TaxID=36930 RepID=UPI002ED39EE0